MEIMTLQHYRGRLDDHDKAIYDKMFEKWMKFEKHFSIPTPHAPLSELINAIHKDNPILFYINYYNVSYTQSIFGITIDGGYLYDKEFAKKHLTKCKEWGEYIVKNMPKGITVKQKALWLHDAVIANVKYGNGDNIRSHNIIGVIADGVAVCEGIAMTYKFLCDLAGVPCIFISGNHVEGPHAWNMLWIDGGCTFVDVTNDISESVGGRYGRTYFMRKASEMVGYSWDGGNIPTCNLGNDRSGMFEAYSQEDVVRIIKENISKDSIGIHLNYMNEVNTLKLNMLITYCSLRCPSVATRSVSYSTNPVVIYFKKQ